MLLSRVNRRSRRELENCVGNSEENTQEEQSQIQSLKQNEYSDRIEWKEIFACGNYVTFSGFSESSFHIVTELS